MKNYKYNILFVLLTLTLDLALASSRSDSNQLAGDRNSRIEKRLTSIGTGKTLGTQEKNGKNCSIEITEYHGDEKNGDYNPKLKGNFKIHLDLNSLGGGYFFFIGPNINRDFLGVHFDSTTYQFISRVVLEDGDEKRKFIVEDYEGKNTYTDNSYLRRSLIFTLSDSKNEVTITSDPETWATASATCVLTLAPDFTFTTIDVHNRNSIFY